MTDSKVEQSLMRLDPQSLLQTAIESGSSIETLERLVALAKDVREVQAKEAWYEAMAKFQKDCPQIKKTATAKIVSRRTGTTYSYSYAPLDEIMAIIQPVLTPLGLSVSWVSRIEPDQVIVTCWVAHTLGHKESSGEVPMPIVQDDGTGANPAQRVGIALTYAKRYSLLGIIGKAPEDDDDTESQEADQGEHPPSGQPQSQSSDTVITENHVRRFSAIATGMKWSDDQVHTLISGFHYNSRKEILVKDYEAIVEKLKAGPPKA